MQQTHDAFADIDATFGKPQAPDPDQTPRATGSTQEPQRVPNGKRTASRGVEPAAGGTINWPLNVGTASCSANGPLPVLTLNFDGSPHIDYNKSDKTIDVSIKGGITSTLTMAGTTSTECTWEAPPIAQIPIIGPFVLKLKPTISASLNPPPGEDSKLDLTTSARAYAAVYYNGAESGPEAGHALNFDGASHSPLGGGSARLDIGVKASFGLPEFGEFELGPEVALTIGGSLQIGPPDPSDDIYSRHLAGPHCFDLTAGPFIEFGAAFLLPFFDLHLDIARFDPAKQVLMRGPCVGYLGTITTSWAGSYPKGGAGCTAQSCPSLEWSHVITQTLQAGMADFNENYGIVVQPYDWTWSGTETREDDIATTYDGSRSTPCKWTTTSNGAGAVSWDDITDASDAWRTKSWQGWATGAGNYYSTDFLGATGQASTVVEGDPDWCGEDSVNGVTPPFLDANGEAGALDLSHPTINVTLTSWPAYHPERAWNITFNLTRTEYSRADGGGGA